MGTIVKARRRKQEKMVDCISQGVDSDKRWSSISEKPNVSAADRNRR